jgi:hypothetical protein
MERSKKVRKCALITPRRPISEKSLIQQYAEACYADDKLMEQLRMNIRRRIGKHVRSLAWAAKQWVQYPTVKKFVLARAKARLAEKSMDDIPSVNCYEYAHGRVRYLTYRQEMEELARVHGRLSAEAWFFTVVTNAHKRTIGTARLWEYNVMFAAHLVPDWCTVSSEEEQGPQKSLDCEPAHLVVAHSSEHCEDGLTGDILKKVLVSVFPEIGVCDAWESPITCIWRGALECALLTERVLYRELRKGTKIVRYYNFPFWIQGVPPWLEHRYAYQGPQEYRTVLSLDSRRINEVVLGWRNMGYVTFTYDAVNQFKETPLYAILTGRVCYATIYKKCNIFQGLDTLIGKPVPFNTRQIKSKRKEKCNDAKRKETLR